MRSVSIWRMCQKKKYANRVDVCRGQGAKRRSQLSVWQTWLEDRKGVRDNPWETAWWTRCPISALLLPPCVLCHGYQRGLLMQPVNVFFSGRSERGTNVSRSVSYTINVNCPGMHKRKETTTEHSNSLNVENQPATSPENLLSPFGLYVVWNLIDWNCFFVFSCDIYLIYMRHNQHTLSSVSILLPYFKVVKEKKQIYIHTKSENEKLYSLFITHILSLYYILYNSRFNTHLHVAYWKMTWHMRKYSTYSTHDIFLCTAAAFCFKWFIT